MTQITDMGGELIGQRSMSPGRAGGCSSHHFGTVELEAAQLVIAILTSASTSQNINVSSLHVQEILILVILGETVRVGDVCLRGRMSGGDCPGGGSLRRAIVSGTNVQTPSPVTSGRTDIRAIGL